MDKNEKKHCSCWGYSVLLGLGGEQRVLDYKGI